MGAHVEVGGQCAGVHHSFLSFPHVDSEDWTQVGRRGDRHLYPLHLFASPVNVVVELWDFIISSTFQFKGLSVSSLVLRDRISCRTGWLHCIAEHDLNFCTPYSHLQELGLWLCTTTMPSSAYELLSLLWRNWIVVYSCVCHGAYESI